MPGLIASVLIMALISPCLCMGWNDATFHNVMEYGAHGDGKSDESQAFLRAWQNTCGANGAATLIVPLGKTFMMSSIKLYGACNATTIHIQILGKIVAPAMDAWVGDRSVWIQIAYVNGLTIDGGGVLDGYGSSWWLKCRKTCIRPTLIDFHSCNDLSVGHLTIINSPRIHIAIDGCEGVRLFHINIHSPPHTHNTDGIDIAFSKRILIEDSAIGTGDDCIAIISGCSYINVTGVTCGPGHGISIGSLGKHQSYATVEEVYVQNCSFIGTQNGARIKTYQGGSGYARKITFEQITLVRASNPIHIHQHYNDPEQMGGVKVSEVTYREFHGTSADDRAIVLDCCSSGCYNLVFDQINIVSSQPRKKAHAFCRNAHGKIVGSPVPNVPCLLN